MVKIAHSVINVHVYDILCGPNGNPITSIISLRLIICTSSLDIHYCYVVTDANFMILVFRQKTQWNSWPPSRNTKEMGM